MAKFWLCASIGFVLFAFAHLGRGQDSKDANKGWMDYDDLKEADRLKDRPGNYQILGAISEFFDKSYQICPDVGRCVYPLQMDSKTLANREEFEEWRDKGPRRNKLRQYNVNIKSLDIYDAEEMERSVDLRMKIGSQYKQERFLTVRKRHPGRAVVVLLDAELHSLQSKKIEGGGKKGSMILYLVRVKDNWHLAWYNK